MSHIVVLISLQDNENLSSSLMIDSIEQDIEIMQWSKCRETDIGVPILSGNPMNCYTQQHYYKCILIAYVTLFI